MTMQGDENKRAYNALLTLLDNESQKKCKRSKQELDEKIELGPSNSKNVDDVEGVEESEAEDDNEEDEIQVQDDNEGDALDPFESHFANPSAFDAPNAWAQKAVRSLPLLGSRSIFQFAGDSKCQLIKEKIVKFSPLSTKSAMSKIKHRLQAPFSRANSSSQITPLQAQFASPLLNYQDLFITDRTWQNHDEYLNLSVLHIVNHIYKTRDRVLKNNSKLREQILKRRERKHRVCLDADGQDQYKGPSAEEESDEEDTDKYRDQGFTRPKVLVMVPTRNSAYEFVNRMSSISGLSQAERKKRFKEAFYSPNSDLQNKPEDFQKTFAGNSNEVFCLGIKFTRQALKLYSSFYSSDLIVASPLGLRLIVDKKDYDFLSSIEVCLCDQLDAVAMQSWTNIKHVFSRMNLTPKNPHDCDFSRVREWYLDEKAKYLRQTILLSAYATPEMVALFNKSCHNVAGKLRTKHEYSGIISSLRIHIRQVFTRVGVSDFMQDSKQRLEHFANGLLPRLTRGAQNEGILVVAPSYTDFVLLRNYLESNNHSYVSLSEYTLPSRISRGRTFFADSRAKIMLYSARLHHYRRYGIKGARTVLFYGLPDNPTFYQEFVRGLARTVKEHQIDPDLLKVHVLFSKWDALKLERIVGTRRMASLIEGNDDTHEFY